MQQEELLKQLKSTDTRIRDKAYETLYRIAYPTCASYVLRNSGTEEEAGDIFRDALVIFLQNMREKMGFKLTAKIQTYLYSIVRNLWLKKLNKKSRSLEQTWEDEKMERLPKQSVELFFGEDERANEPLGNLLLCAMRVFQNFKNEDCKKVISLFYFEKWSMEEIAEEMGYKSAGFTRNRRYRCVNYLRKEVLKNCSSPKK